MEDFPHPPSPQMVIVIFWGSWRDIAVCCEMCLWKRAVEVESIDDCAMAAGMCLRRSEGS